MYAKVIVDISVSQVDRLFTYAVPCGAKLSVGQRVLVPFGKGGRCTEGFILELFDDFDGDFELKEIIKPMEAYPALDEKQLELAAWIKKAYHCTMADALRLMIPAQLRGMRVKEKYIRTYSLIPEKLDEIKAALYNKSGTCKAPKQALLIDALEKLGEATSADISLICPGCESALFALVKKGLIEKNDRISYRRPGKNKIYAQTPPPTLTDEQQNALTKINAALEKGQGTLLLKGVTGSGKTEVYIRAIENVLQLGGGAIMLVPEISLTPQTVSRFMSRFSGNVAVLHSRLSPGERFDEWRRIRSGEARVVVGARSAVFAPISRLSLIVIDEEHEPSYLSETTPRYSAAEVALRRCKICGSVLLLGSATPSVTSRFRAQHGKYELIELSKRVNDMPMPKVEIVDMRSEFLSGNSSIFGTTLTNALTECLARGEQAILFMNRRGYSGFVTCRGCGYRFTCDDCDVTMTYHKYDNQLKCHYCGRQMPLPKVCPNCKRPYLKHFGIGTEQVEEQFLELFPKASYIRMDSDTTSGKDAHERLLSSFAQGEASVLIGTQMVAKGLDFPNVTLVGVVFSDALLNIPDYRSGERTFQLLTQVAGRAGRADKEGRVIIQTFTPDHSIIRLAAEQDYDSFYALAIKERQNALFPPFSLFVRCAFRGENELELHELSLAFAKKAFDGLKAAASEIGAPENEIIYIVAAPAPIKRLRGQFIYHVLIKLLRTKHTGALLDSVYSLADTQDAPEFCGVELDPKF